MLEISNTIFNKKVDSVHLFVLLMALFSTPLLNAQSNCNASFTYDMTQCPNIYFFDNSTADSVINCWMYDYNGEGSVDWCENAHNKFNVNGAYPVCISIMTLDGCMGSWCDTIIIDCNCDEPQSQFSYTQAVNIVDFSDQSIYSDPPNTSWLWNFGDGTTSNDINPTHSYTGNGTFMVCLTVSDSCDTSTYCSNIIVNTVGVEQLFSSSSNISCYPNPASNSLQIHISELEGSNKDVELRLFNLSGKLVHQSSAITIDGKIDLDISSILNGSYDLFITDSEKIAEHIQISIQH